MNILSQQFQEISRRAAQELTPAQWRSFMAFAFGAVTEELALTGKTKSVSLELLTAELDKNKKPLEPIRTEDEPDYCAYDEIAHED